MQKKASPRSRDGLSRRSDCDRLSLYEAELLNRCEGILNGQAHSRSCAILVDDSDALRFVRAGEHFIVFLDQPDEVVIVDILHSRSDLPRHLAALKALRNEGI